MTENEDASDRERAIRAHREEARAWAVKELAQFTRSAWLSPINGPKTTEERDGD